jgi:hypothetical protein
VVGSCKNCFSLIRSDTGSPSKSRLTLVPPIPMDVSMKRLLGCALPPLEFIVFFRIVPRGQIGPQHGFEEYRNSFKRRSGGFPNPFGGALRLLLGHVRCFENGFCVFNIVPGGHIGPQKCRRISCSSIWGRSGNPRGGRKRRRGSPKSIQEAFQRSFGPVWGRLGAAGGQ